MGMGLISVNFFQIIRAWQKHPQNTAGRVLGLGASPCP